MSWGFLPGAEPGGGGGSGIAQVRHDKTIHVSADSPDATDTRTGLNKFDAAKPFATLAAAVAVQAAGETIHMHAGTYVESVEVEGVPFLGPPKTIIADGAVLDGQLTIDGHLAIDAVFVKGLRIAPTTTPVEAALIAKDTPFLHLADVTIQNQQDTTANLVGVDLPAGGQVIGTAGSEIDVRRSSGNLQTGHVAATRWGASFAGSSFRSLRMVAADGSGKASAVSTARLAGTTFGPLDISNCILELWSSHTSATHNCHVIHGVTGTTAEVRVTGCGVRAQGAFGGNSAKWMPALLEAGCTSKVVFEATSFARFGGEPQASQWYLSGAAEAASSVILANVSWTSRAVNDFPRRLTGIGSDLGSIAHDAANNFANQEKYISGFTLLRGATGQQEVYPTLAAAHAAALDNDTIKLPPGDIAEDLVLTKSIVIEPAAGVGTSRIVGSAATGTRLTFAPGSDGAVIRNIGVVAPTDALYGIVANGAVGSVQGCFFYGQTGSGRCLGSLLGQLNVQGCIYMSGTCGVFLFGNGQTAAINFSDVAILSGTISFGAIFRGDCSVFGDGFSTVSGPAAPTVTTGIQINQSTVEVNRINLIGCTTALDVVSDDIDVQLRDMSASNCTADIVVDSALTGTGARLSITASEFSLEKSSFPADWIDTANVQLDFRDDATADQSLTIIGGGVRVGSLGQGTTSATGEGGFTNLGMVCKRNTNFEAGAWSDVTPELVSSVGSTADIFSAVSAGAAFYIGSDEPISAWGGEWTVAGDVLRSSDYDNTPNVIVETWDGDSWEPLSVMNVQGFAPNYTSYADELFSATEAQVALLGKGWNTLPAKKTLDSAEKYWVRVRLLAGITTSPTAEYLRIAGSFTHNGEDGTMHMFGTAREETLHAQWTMSALYGGALSSETVGFSANIAVPAQNNEMVNNAVDDKFGIIFCPEDVDTSHPLKFRFDYYTLAASTGDWELDMWVATKRQGENYQALGFERNSATVTTISSAAAFKARRVEVEFMLDHMKPGDRIGIRFSRDATGSNDPPDTLVDSIVLTDVDCVYTKWRQ